MVPLFMVFQNNDNEAKTFGEFKEKNFGDVMGEDEN